MEVLKRLMRSSERSEERQLAGEGKSAEEKPQEVGSALIRLTSKLREWDVPDTDTEDIWWRGYDLHDDHDLGWSLHDPRLAEAGILVCKVAGVTHHEGMQADDAGPGRPFALVPEPENPYDPNAVAIWDAGRKVQVGYVPRDLARTVSSALEAGTRLEAMCLAELIRKPREERVGLRVLLAPRGVVGGWPAA
jgi:hypothetical protein